MTIRIKGLIAGLKVDLSIEGLDGDALSQLVSGLSKPGEDGLTASNEKSPTELDENLQAKTEAQVLIDERGEVLSCDLVSYLTKQNFSDHAIKKALLLLREQGEVAVGRSDDGLQRIYRKR